MQESEIQTVFAECFRFPEAVRLLWEGAQKTLAEWGMDPEDLASLCGIIVRLADHRLLLIDKCGSPPGSEKVANQVRHYREQASKLLQWAAAPAPDPDWASIAERLKSNGAAIFESRNQTRG